MSRQIDIITFVISNTGKATDGPPFTLFTIQYIHRGDGWRSRLECLTRLRKVECSNPSRDRPNSLKQVVTAPLLNNRQHVMIIVHVVWCPVPHCQWPFMPSIVQYLHPFTGLNMSKDSWVGRKPPNKPTISIYLMYWPYSVNSFFFWGFTHLISHL